jgi:hypothetical protein
MDTSSAVYISLEAVIGLMSCAGNGIVLLLIIRNRSLKTVTNCFVASLALADLVVGVAVTPIAVLSYLGLPHNFLGCVFTNCFIIAFCTISIFNLLAVALERYIAIIHPFAYTKHLNVKRSLTANIGLWCVGLFVGFIPMYGWNLKELYNENWICGFVTVIDMKFTVYFIFFGCILVPLFFICAIYFRIYLIVRKQMIQIAALEIPSTTQQESSVPKSTLRREIKAAKSLAIIVFLFASMWIPINVLNSITVMCESCSHPMELLLVTILLSHANSAVNPFLYAYGNSNFRKAFRKMICKTTDIDT